VVLLGLAADGIVFGTGLVFFIRPGRDHVLEVGDGPGAAGGGWLTLLSTRMK
jgi:hypothetical protein